jgi:hypothetical protein
MNVRVAMRVIWIAVSTLLSTACWATSLGRPAFALTYEKLDYVGIVSVIEAKPDLARGIVTTTVSELEALKGGRPNRQFSLTVPMSDLIPKTDRLLVLVPKTTGQAMQWVFPIEGEGDEAFLFAARDNAFFDGTWLSSNEKMPFFVVEQNRIVAAMKLSAVRRYIGCVRASRKGKDSECRQ